MCILNIFYHHIQKFLLMAEYYAEIWSAMFVYMMADINNYSKLAYTLCSDWPVPLCSALLSYSCCFPTTKYSNVHKL